MEDIVDDWTEEVLEVEDLTFWIISAQKKSKIIILVSLEYFKEKSMKIEWIGKVPIIISMNSMQIIAFAHCSTNLFTITMYFYTAMRRLIIIWSGYAKKILKIVSYNLTHAQPFCCY